ncbi:MAG: HEPN domain-containing protein [Acidobacteria bacterium]|nr:HEPN domain-containing protein [Acidobacteriota bacterium]
MPPDHLDPASPVSWLRRARSNLARAKADRSLPEVLYEDLCFDAQQAGEKAIKAILLHLHVAFPKTHAIAELLTLVYENGVVVPDKLRQAGMLTDYAVEARYPGLSERVTEEEYVRAVELADQVVRWAEHILSTPPDPRGGNG